MKKKTIVSIISLIVFFALAVGLSGCFFNDSNQDYTITFYADDKVHSTIAITPQTTQITMPVNPAKEGYIFDGWYYDKDVWKIEFTEASLSEGVSKNLKIYAKFSVDPASLMHAVSFVVDGIEAHSVTLTEGETIPYTFTPTKTGYTFEKWSHSSGSLPTVMGKQSVIINAVFTANTYRIYFQKDNETILSGEALTQNSSGEYITVTYDAPYDATLNSVVAQKSGYEFAYWKHYDGEYTAESVYKIAGNITLTPQWAKEGTAGLVYNYESDAGFYEVTGYTGSEKNVVIPIRYDDGTNGKHPVVWIRQISNTGIESIETQNSITTIYESAFVNCLSLISVTISTSVIALETDVFPPDSGIMLYCKASQIPSGWASDWHSGNTAILNNEQYQLNIFDISNPEDVTVTAKFVPQSIMISEDGIDYTFIPTESYTITGLTVTVAKQYLSQKTEGTFTVRLYGELSAYFVLEIYNDMFRISYDKAESGDIIRNFAGETINKLHGGGITTADYTISGGNLTISQNYLNALKGGEYELLLKGDNSFAKILSLSVYDSDCTPYNVKLDFDINSPYYTILFDCDCKEPTTYAYSINGGTYVPCQKGDIITDQFTPAEQTLTVKCNYNGNISSPYVLPKMDLAAAYIAESFSWGGTIYNKFIADQSELNIFVAYLVHTGVQIDARDMSDPDKPYGYVEGNVYISDTLKSELVSNGNKVLNTANKSFDFPWSFIINSSLLGNVATFTITYTTEPVAIYYTGQQPQPLNDNRTHPEGNRPVSYNNFKINSFLTTEVIESVQELDSLPYGIKPLFNNTQSSLEAKVIYESALEACRTYVSDTMTDYQKVAAIYRYLAVNVTYDYVAIDILDFQTQLNYFNDLQMAKNFITSTLNSESWDTVLEAALAEVRDNADSIKDIKDEVASIVKSLKVFHLQGVFDDGIAVCDGIASALKLMCLIEGIECIEVTGWAGEAHAWNKVRIDGKLFVVDATWGRLNISTILTMSNQWLLVTDETALTGINPHIERNYNDQDGIADLATGDYDYYANTSIGGGYDLAADSQAELNAIIAYYYGLGSKIAEFRYNAGGNAPENAVQAAIIQIKNISFSFFRPNNDRNVWVIDISNLYT